MGIMAQIGIVLAVCLVGEGIAALLPIPFPASVIPPHQGKIQFSHQQHGLLFRAGRRGYPALCGCAVGQPAAAAGHLLHHHAAGVRRYGLGRAAHHARHSEKGGPS